MAKIGQIYKHFKGNIYKILHFAKDSETTEDLVVYQNVKKGDIWVRPLKMWDEIIDNKGTKRFTEINNNEEL